MMNEENSISNTSTANDTSSTSPNQTEEANSLTQSINALKSYNPKAFYQVDSYVDVLDSFSTWRVAKILSIKDDVASVNFDGWTSRWNEVSSYLYLVNLLRWSNLMEAKSSHLRRSHLPILAVLNMLIVSLPLRTQGIPLQRLILIFRSF